MPNRKVPLVTGEYYHVFGRGVEKRDIVGDEHDVHRFLAGLTLFNTQERIGSIYEAGWRIRTGNDQLGSPTSKLVDILAYNLLPNHYHLLLHQLVDGGISMFMQSSNGGYTKYFNQRYERVGPLFQGRYRSEHVSSDAQLRYVSVYVNFNHIVHGLIPLGSRTSKWGVRSSWDEWSAVSQGRTVTPSIVSGNELIVGAYQDLQSYEREGLQLARQVRAHRQHARFDEIDSAFELREHLEVGLPS